MSEFRFSAAERAVLVGVLDEIIPPSDDGRMPGAGAVGVAGYVEQALERAPEMRTVIVPALAALDAAARERTGQGFADLAGEARRAVFADFVVTDVAFLLTLMFHAYAGYYHEPRVAAALGLEPRPPHPKGHEVPPDDLTLLEPVRRRQKLYREC